MYTDGEFPISFAPTGYKVDLIDIYPEENPFDALVGPDIPIWSNELIVRTLPLS